MRLIVSALAAMFLLVGCQQDINNEYSEVSIQDQDGQVLVTSSDFKGASIDENQGRVLVTANFKGSDTAEEVTEQHLNEKIYVYLGDKEIASPTVQTVITSDSIQIAGDFTKEEAEQFVDVINQ
ncbi:SecDF P1 head subdomain-containing protein [Halobacillus salinus]|uniref:SecDF P1 head subdomain-containing protein n=1 Tax=Halobacillus salinus TaxID=192814 RepID=UPI0009A6E95C|nr:hypothetical protein [Halobacillus salinus]